jgi:hypothetical protein
MNNIHLKNGKFGSKANNTRIRAAIRIYFKNWRKPFQCRISVRALARFFNIPKTSLNKYISKIKKQKFEEESKGY